MSQLHLDAVIDAACAMADVDQPDLEPFRSNLDLLVECINAEANLSREGAVATEQRLALPLRNRLEVSDWLRRHPEIADEPIEAPIVVTGLPRSGTTYSQYLFDQEVSTRMLRHWEGARPCPPPALDPESARRRLRDAERAFRRNQQDETRSAVAKIHLMDPDGPEECHPIIEQTFGNVGLYWPYRVPSYFQRCLDSIDLKACYEHHKRVLQLLQWKAERQRWALKWSCHLVAMDELVSVYPDASFVITHRDPVQALASNCSLAALLRRGTSAHVDLHEVGQQMKDMILTYLQHLVAFDEEHGHTGRIAHIDYAEVVDRPEAVMARVYDQLGLELTPQVHEAIVAWRRDNPPGKRGSHDYDLADYGLDARAVADDYAFYTDRFDIPVRAR